MKLGNNSRFEVESKIDEDGLHDTDRLTLTGDFTKCQCWGREDGPSEHDFGIFMENLDTLDVTLMQMRRAMVVLSGSEGS